MSTWAMMLAGATAAVFAVLMVFARSLYVAAICLLVVLFQIAVFFFFAGAPLLAFLQIMIYAGAVMILIVVMIMAAPAPAPQIWSPLAVPKPVAVLIAAVPLVEAGLVVCRGASGAGAVGAALSIQDKLGPVLFGPYGAATEAATFLMFLAGLAILNKRACA